ncbi:MAG TPA: type I 3-dehydroquinate dehydratase [Myxococcales bacterium]
MPANPPEATLCVTGAERTTAAVAARLAAHSDLMHEVRLDLLEKVDADTFALLRSPRVLATCRRREEGGGFEGSESERAYVLEQALASRPGWLDFEASTDRKLRDALCDKAAGHTRIVLSYHGADLAAAEALSREPADVLKIAVPVADASELASVRKVLTKDGRPTVRIGMGDAGLLSRLMPHRFGSPWSYVASDAGNTTAPGQVTVSRARDLRAHEAHKLTPMGVIGGTQVLYSNGQRAYNAYFAAEGLPYHYLPIVSSRPQVLDLLEELGFAGVAVTMPAKIAFMPHVQELDSAARAAGALNTIRFREGRRDGLNTDLPALASLLPHAKPHGRALVLGAGGAARAAICALRSLGWEVVVANRTFEHARALESMHARAVRLEEARGEAFEVLINATPVGSDGESDPVPPGISLKGKTVLDVVMHATTTPLMARAAAEGAKAAISGTEMWVRQGVLQMRAIAGLELSANRLREHLLHV